MFRFPVSLVNTKELEEYVYDDVISINKINDYLILNIEINDEEGSGWIEEDNGYLDSLIELRQQILGRDYRVLYLAWLKGIESYYDPSLEETLEPTVPNNLSQLSDSLQIFVELFEVNEHLIKVGAINSSKITLKDDILVDSIQKLSNTEKDDFLFRLLLEEPNFNLKLKQRLLELSKLSVNKISTEKRTINQLLEEAEKIAELEEQRKKEEARQKKNKGTKGFC